MLHRRAALERGLRLRDQLAVEDVVDLVVLRLAVDRSRRRPAPSGLVNSLEKSRPFAFQCAITSLLVEHLHLADHLVEGAIAHRGHQLAHFLGDEEEVVDDVLGLAGEALAQHRVLRRDADRAGVEMALAHHDAAGRDQRRGGEAELVGAEQRADHDVAAGADAAVDLHRDAAAQPVGDQRLVGFGEADFPRAAGMLDRGQRRSAGAAFEAGDGDMVGARLGDAGGDRADADFGDELHRHVARRVDVLQVEDELRQILDRIDVVMRRRRDQADARRRVAHLGDDLRRPCGRAIVRLRRAWRPAPS